ncbi:hypothetical protein EZV62_010792 [Acer yangbiense]|uniref:Uncharacterized protein n=1 Tax=Acer yangbiense TaxID=1000413 RepID=A0A5C7I468_9ROSI|nr:hypothetical protein EZV62_010792 [Acer yangbiense]
MRQREVLVSFRTPQHPSLGTNHWGGASPLLARDIPKESLDQRYLRLNSIRSRDEIFPADEEDDFNYQLSHKTHHAPKVVHDQSAPRTPGHSSRLGFLSKLTAARKEKAVLGSKKSWFPRWDPKHRWPQVNKSTKDLLVLTCNIEDCKWRVRATKLKDCESFRVRKYEPDYTCSLDSFHFDHRQTSSKLIGHCINSKFEGTSQSYRLNDIIEDMKKQCGMIFSYNKGWRVGEVALGLARGSPDDSFSILLLYCHILEMKIPETVTFIDTDVVNHFSQNMKAKFRGVEVHDIFYKCSKVYQVVEFNQIMAQIWGINESVAQYLNEVDPTKWTRSQFDGRRYCIMTTNIAESILKDARELPVIKLVELKRGLL